MSRLWSCLKGAWLLEAEIEDRQLEVQRTVWIPRTKRQCCLATVLLALRKHRCAPEDRHGLYQWDDSGSQTTTEQRW